MFCFGSRKWPIGTLNDPTPLTWFIFFSSHNLVPLRGKLSPSPLHKFPKSDFFSKLDRGSFPYSINRDDMIRPAHLLNLLNLLHFTCFIYMKMNPTWITLNGELTQARARNSTNTGQNEIDPINSVNAEVTYVSDMLCTKA